MQTDARLKREARTIETMIQLYCSDQHRPQGELCHECQALLDYANTRLKRCPFQEKKPTCAKCPVHCYQASMREQVRTVMRYAGPRMILRHPVLAIAHLADGIRKHPPRGINQKKPAGSSRREK